MKKIIPAIIVCTPAIPDALSLAENWSYISSVVSLVLLLIVIFFYRKRDKGDDQEYIQLIAALGTALVFSVGFSVYRLGSGVTVTAQAFPEAAQTIAETVGTEDRLNQMQEEFTNRLIALEQIAVLEAKLNSSERSLQAMERDAQERERAVQAMERDAQEQERALQEAERQAREVERTKVKLEAEQEANQVEASLYWDQGLRADVPTYVFVDEREELLHWEQQRPTDIVLEAYRALDFYLYSGKPRDFSVVFRIASEDGKVVWEHQDQVFANQVIAERAEETGAEDFFDLSWTGPLIRIPATHLQTGAYLSCVTFTDIETSEQWHDKSAGFFNLEFVEVTKLGGGFNRPINKLPKRWELDHELDTRAFSDEFRELCQG